MKKTLILLIIGMIVFSMATMDSQAARKSKKSATAITQDDINTMSATIDNLTRKVYSNSLFSPQDNAKMIEVKTRTPIINISMTCFRIYLSSSFIFSI